MKSTHALSCRVGDLDYLRGEVVGAGITIVEVIDESEGDASYEPRHIMVDCSDVEADAFNADRPSRFCLLKCRDEDAAASLDIREDGWCGHCGAVFFNRGADDGDACDNCGKSLKENPHEGAITPNFLEVMSSSCLLCGCSAAA